MSNRTLSLDDEIHHYLLKMSLREPEVLRELRVETAKHPMARMQISPEQGQFMALLVNLMAARRCIEVGVFTGYSALAVALVLPEGGQIIACDVNVEWTRIARQFWEEAGVAEKIDLRIGPAIETLDALLANGGAGRFDFVFIDADKINYLNYYERALLLLQPGGLIGVDNVLWGGDVVDPTKQDDETVAIRDFNQHLKRDERVDLSMVPIGDGLTLARKR